MAKSFWSEKDQRLVTLSSSNPRTAHDDLPLPGGKSIPDTDSTALARNLAAWGVSGVSASSSREQNLARYNWHLQNIRRLAADKAVAEWIRSKS
jgi:hypothetical protein